MVDTEAENGRDLKPRDKFYMGSIPIPPIRVDSQARLTAIDSRSILVGVLRFKSGSTHEIVAHKLYDAILKKEMIALEEQFIY